jgi:D-3-phosphoglycerate dehydrogenase / 2-oxoglutarate reductase
VSFGSKDPSLRSTLEATVSQVTYNPHRRPLEAAELIGLVGEADGFIAGIDHVDASVISAAQSLRVISCYGVGYDRIDVAEATRQGIIVTNAAGANAVSVAELAVALILSLARQVPYANDLVHQGQWPYVDGMGIRGKTVGIVGFGAIGREVAKRLSGFDCRIIAYDPYIPCDISAQFAIPLTSLDQVLAESDFITLHAPVTADTKGMINRDALRKVKKGTMLVNTARGELIDEDALLDALKSGQLKGAGLDVLQKEPIRADSPLLSLPQVIITPHSGSSTDDALNRMGWAALNNCLAVLRGEKPNNVVNKEVLENLAFS